MSDSTLAIDEFLTLHPDLQLSNPGECGFGRPCVGIIERQSECYVDYYRYETSTYNALDICTAAEEHRPLDAYHKHPCLAVLALGATPDYNEALRQLNAWIAKILESDFEFYAAPSNDTMRLLNIDHPPIGIRDTQKREGANE